MIYGVVCEFSDRVQDGRTLRDIFEHGQGEMSELDIEILKHNTGVRNGPDGIVGEAIDVIACMMDLIRKYDPDVTEEQLAEKMREKCVKWETKTNAGAYTKG